MPVLNPGKSFLVLKENSHFNKMHAVSVVVVKPLLHIVVVCLSVLMFFSMTDAGQAGPFEDIFKSIRNSFARPTPKPRPPQPRQSSPRKRNESPPSDATDVSNTQLAPTPTPVPVPPNPSNVRVAKATAAQKNRTGDLPYGIPVPGKQGLVTSPFSPDSGYIDVRSFPPGTQVRDPYTGKIFLTP
jgi:hypothetical protein